MHWLEMQVSRLYQLSLAHEGWERRAIERAQPARSQSTNVAVAKKSYQAFVSAAQSLVREVAARPGVTACFACHDGLVLEAAGRPCDFEALSAMTQTCAMAGKEAAETLSLGSVQQLVIVGRKDKLALFVIGQLQIGVLSPVSVSLAATLS